MTVTDSTLAALLLTNRIVDVGHKPLSSGEFWALCDSIGDPSALAGMHSSEISERLSISPPEADRYAALLSAGTAFSFERERLEEEGIRLISALDEAFPARLRHLLGSACPAFVLAAGPIEFLSLPAIGVVGSRDASEAALEVAGDAARVAAQGTKALVSGLARGVDQASMSAALDAGGAVIGIPAEGLRVAARNSEIRRRVHAGELCLASPYGPGMRFTTANAMGRNKVVYGLSEVTLVVCSDLGTGGTWEGAKEAQRRKFGTVAVWRGSGEGAGNEKLESLGLIAIRSVKELLGLDLIDRRPSPTQATLFD